MQEINQQNLREELLQAVPELKPYFEGPYSQPTTCGLFTDACLYAYSLVEAGEEASLVRLLAVVEKCQEYGDEEVNNEACVCFLESLSNMMKVTSLKPWIRSLLGPRSRQFWDAWNEPF